MGFEARGDIETKFEAEFSIVIFVGLLIFIFISECAIRATSLMLKNANYLKNDQRVALLTRAKLFS